MLNASNHFLKRHCERMLGMKDEKEIKQYIVQNRDRLIEDANKMFSYADFIYRGQIGDNTTKNYYIRDNIIIVTDSQNTTFVTLYKVDFGFPEQTNRMVAKDLLKIIDELNNRLGDEEEGIEEFVEVKNHEVENINEQIKSLEEQLKIFKEQKNFIEKEISNKKKTSNVTREELRRNVLLLCNSLEYKKDLQEMA